MKIIELTQTTPLVQDETGTIRVKGSRIPLDTVVHEFKQGATAEQIQDSFPSLSLRDIYAVIAFYLDRQSEVEIYLAEREAEAQQIRQEIESRPEIAEFRHQLRARRALLTKAS